MNDNITVFSVGRIEAVLLGEVRKLKVRPNNFASLVANKNVRPAVSEKRVIEEDNTIAAILGNEGVNNKILPKENNAARTTSKSAVVPDIKASSNLGDLSLKLRKMALAAEHNTYKGKVLLHAVSQLDDLDKNVSNLKETIGSNNVILEKLEAAKSIEDRDLRKLNSIFEATTEATYSNLDIHVDRNTDEDPMALANIELTNIRESLNNIGTISASVKAKITKITEKCDEIKMKIAKLETEINNLNQAKVDLCNKILTTDLQSAEELDKIIAAQRESVKQYEAKNEKFNETIEMLKSKISYDDADATLDNPFSNLREDNTSF